MSEHITHMVGSDNFSNFFDQLPHILISSWQLAALQKQISSEIFHIFSVYSSYVEISHMVQKDVYWRYSYW